MTNDQGIPHEVEVMNMMNCIGPDEIQYWGRNTRFRRAKGIWHREVGIGQWARVSEPIMGEKVERPPYTGKTVRVFYCDPTIRKLRWTEYEDVGNILDTFFAVWADDKETKWYEIPNARRTAFDSAPDKLAWLNTPSDSSSVGYVSGYGMSGPRDRGRDNPACIIYVADSRPALDNLPHL